MQYLMGGYWLLDYIPADVLALALVVLCVVILIPGREYFEGGLGYNVCLSSQLGDVALIGCISVGARIVQRGCVVPMALNSMGFSWFCVCAAVLMAVAWQGMIVLCSGGKWGTVMDAYHNVFAAPLLFYFLLLTMPLVYCCGSSSQKLWTLSMFLAWVGFLLFDKKTGRLQQPEWLKKHGFGFILKK